LISSSRCSVLLVMGINAPGAGAQEVARCIPLIDGEVVPLHAPPLEVGLLKAGSTGEIQPAGQQTQVEPEVAGHDLLQHPLGILRPILDVSGIQRKILRVLDEEIVDLHRADPPHRITIHLHVDGLIHDVIQATPRFDRWRDRQRCSS
jgi:hypothetical protein